LNKPLLRIVVFMTLTMLSGCAVGPDYTRPQVSVPEAFKEAKNWKEASPRDDKISVDWWKVFNDSLLNALEEQVNISNQSLAQAEAQFRQAQAVVSGARANFFPTVGAAAAASRSRNSANGNNTAVQDTTNQFSLSLNTSWEIDLWGRVRRQVESSTASAQASAADLQALRLSTQGELAQDYFQLKTLDAQKKIFDDTIVAYEKALELTRNRYAAGVAAKADVVAALTQLQTTQAQAIDIGVQRAQLEHAIAILIGKPPSDFSIKEAPVAMTLPQMPSAVPSEILERRPDVASAERRVAAANAQIGVAKAAYYPSLTLSASTGYQSSILADLFKSPSFFWALGPATLAQTIFDAGARKSLTDQAIASYDATVAGYRQTVLASFQQVEDNLAALRILAEEARAQDEAVGSARESVILTTNQYKAGIVSYLNVITVQAIALANERTALGIEGQRLTAAILLIKALGGGWDASELYGTHRGASDKAAFPSEKLQQGPDKKAP
jgi:NodT family efflux transporter outer membrane factor (OMF) lipoprotein